MYQIDKIKISLPKDVAFIIHTIEQAGFEAYAVGGCVRDSILGKEPNDWDITTSALPHQIKALFPHTIDTGIAHGTVTILRNHIGYEVTTYRIDGEYEDARHPKEVLFTSNLIEDLKRRDFTINAMAYNDRSGIVDAFDGIGDLNKGVIKAVGDAKERFMEDALRIMRAVRFAAQLGFVIEENTKKAIQELANTLSKISAERIQVELTKLVTSKNPDFVRQLYETGITKVILPEFDLAMETTQNHPHHCYSVGEHIIHSMQAISDEEKELRKLRFAMLFHDLGKTQTKTTDEQGIDHFHGHALISADMAKAILRRLKFDNDTIDVVTRLVKHHDIKIIEQPKYVRRALLKIGEDIFPLLLLVKYADVKAQSSYLREEKIRSLDQIKEIYQDILEKKQCISLKMLALNGSDLVKLGVEPGKEIGRLLQELLLYVIEEPSRNTREELLRQLKKLTTQNN